MMQTAAASAAGSAPATLNGRELDAAAASAARPMDSQSLSSRAVRSPAQVAVAISTGRLDATLSPPREDEQAAHSNFVQAMLQHMPNEAFAPRLGGCADMSRVLTAVVIDTVAGMLCRIPGRDPRHAAQLQQLSASRTHHGVNHVDILQVPIVNQDGHPGKFDPGKLAKVNEADDAVVNWARGTSSYGGSSSSSSSGTSSALALKARLQVRQGLLAARSVQMLQGREHAAIRSETASQVACDVISIGTAAEVLAVIRAAMVGPGRQLPVDILPNAIPEAIKGSSARLCQDIFAGAALVNPKTDAGSTSIISGPLSCVSVVSRLAKASKTKGGQAAGGKKAQQAELMRQLGTLRSKRRSRPSGERRYVKAEHARLEREGRGQATISTVSIFQHERVAALAKAAGMLASCLLSTDDKTARTARVNQAVQLASSLSERQCVELGYNEALLSLEVSAQTSLRRALQSLHSEVESEDDKKGVKVVIDSLITLSGEDAGLAAHLAAVASVAQDDGNDQSVGLKVMLGLIALADFTALGLRMGIYYWSSDGSDDATFEARPVQFPVSLCGNAIVQALVKARDEVFRNRKGCTVQACPPASEGGLELNHPSGLDRTQQAAFCSLIDACIGRSTAAFINVVGDCASAGVSIDSGDHIVESYWMSRHQACIVRNANVAALGDGAVDHVKRWLNDTTKEAPACESRIETVFAIANQLGFSSPAGAPLNSAEHSAFKLWVLAESKARAPLSRFETACDLVASRYPHDAGVVPAVVRLLVTDTTSRCVHFRRAGIDLAAVAVVATQLDEDSIQDEGEPADRTATSGAAAGLPASSDSTGPSPLDQLVDLTAVAIHTLANRCGYSFDSPDGEGKDAGDDGCRVADLDEVARIINRDRRIPSRMLYKLPDVVAAGGPKQFPRLSDVALLAASHLRSVRVGIKNTIGVSRTVERLSRSDRTKWIASSKCKKAWRDCNALGSHAVLDGMLSRSMSDKLFRIPIQYGFKEACDAASDGEPACCQFPVCLPYRMIEFPVAAALAIDMTQKKNPHKHILAGISGASSSAMNACLRQYRLLLPDCSPGGVERHRVSSCLKALLEYDGRATPASLIKNMWLPKDVRERVSPDVVAETDSSIELVVTIAPGLHSLASAKSGIPLLSSCDLPDSEEPIHIVRALLPGVLARAALIGAGLHIDRLKSSSFFPGQIPASSMELDLQVGPTSGSGVSRTRAGVDSDEDSTAAGSERRLRQHHGLSSALESSSSSAAAQQPEGPGTRRSAPMFKNKSEPNADGNEKDPEEPPRRRRQLNSQGRLQRMSIARRPTTSRGTGAIRPSVLSMIAGADAMDEEEEEEKQVRPETTHRVQKMMRRLGKSVGRFYRDAQTNEMPVSSVYNIRDQDDKLKSMRDEHVKETLANLASSRKVRIVDGRVIKLQSESSAGAAVDAGSPAAGIVSGGSGSTSAQSQVGLAGLEMPEGPSPTLGDKRKLSARTPPAQGRDYWQQGDLRPCSPYQAADWMECAVHMRPMAVCVLAPLLGLRTGWSVRCIAAVHAL